MLAAEAAGVGVQEFVDANAAAFTGLAEPLSLSVDDLIRTSSDPRHRAGVERLWRACAARGDLYRKHYEGLYCVGCEQFYTTGGADRRALSRPRHGAGPGRRRRTGSSACPATPRQLRGLIADGTIRIEPAERRNEVLALIDGGLRGLLRLPQHRARPRLGHPGPRRPGPGHLRVVGRARQLPHRTGLRRRRREPPRWWTGASQRIHLLGKGVLRFHAVYWPAMLLSAGEALPTDIAVHGYLTENGRKISKSSGATVDPYDLVGTYGTDAVRWWLLREVPRGADADFTARPPRRPRQRRARQRLRQPRQPGRLPDPPLPRRPRPGHRTASAPDAAALEEAISDAPGLIAAALEDFDFRRATEAVWQIADEANRYVNRARPWDLAKAGDRAELDAVLSALLRACQAIGTQLTPFLPDAAARITRQCAPDATGLLPRPAPLLPRIALPVPASAPAQG